ncbi:hypothetical protein Y032_0007g3210 [Ancylostoma ceylanicum]|uniref:Uncharacterized protein n=1 Tax=Ancylostoma ceylanicum TaxID=53326 RepID=A0A016VN05_9BILA|nr:hypothetical protein Y032_0007g3210 [Ancylostoma ceylanicum]
MILAGLRAIRFLKIFYRNGYSDRSSWANTIEKRTLLYGRVDGMAYEIAFKEGLPYDCTCPVCDQSELHESIGNVSCLFFIVLLH